MVQSTPIYGIRYREDGDSPDIPEVSQFLAEDVEDALSDGTKALVVASASAAGDLLTGSSNGVNATAVTSGSDSTASASYVNLAGTGSVTSFSFTKRYASTRIRVEMICSLRSSAGGSGAMVGVRINGVDYDIARVQCATTSERYVVPGIRYITGVGTGVWTVQGRWKVDNGAVTLTRDVFDWLTIDAREVA